MGAEVLSCSTDSRFSHKIWQETELSKMVPGGVPYPMLSDAGGRIGQVYGVYDEAAGVNNRGRFIIDPDGVIQAIEILTAPVGRNPDELIRQLSAFQHVRKTGEATPSGWQPGQPTLKPGPDLVGKVWTVWRPAGHRAIVTDKLEPFECGSVERIHRRGGVFLASQPQPDDFRQAKKGGIKTVINLRLADELDWDEAKLMDQLGLEYHHVPFKAPETLTDEVFSKVRALLNTEAKRPILLHCSSSNRVGAIWLAHRVLDHGLAVQQAEKEAKIVGLKLPAYEERAKDYIAQERSSER